MSTKPGKSMDDIMAEIASAMDVPEQRADAPQAEPEDANPEPVQQMLAADIRLVEALLFASPEPLSEQLIAARLPEGRDIRQILQTLARDYQGRGIELKCAGKTWAFRTAPDLAAALQIEVQQPRKLTRAGLETLAIIAYHQPVTRTEIEEIRSVALSKGTLDLLLEAGWIKPRGRKRVPGRPVLWVTTDQFLDHFGLEHKDDLPGIAELKAAGLLDNRPGVAKYGITGEESLPPSVETETDANQAKTIEEDLTAHIPVSEG